jgi:peptide/nickel transport system ATP-binding protein/Fe3+-transporting ATPase
MVWDAVLRWAKRHGVGVLAISHDRNLLRRIAHRIDETFAPTDRAESQAVHRAAA